MINTVKIHTAPEELLGAPQHEGRGSQAPLVSFHDILRGRMQETVDPTRPLQLDQAASPRREPSADTTALPDTTRMKSESRNDAENTGRVNRPDTETPAQERPRALDTERHATQEGRADRAETPQKEERPSGRKERPEAETTGTMAAEHQKMQGSSPAERKQSVEALPRPADTAARRQVVQAKAIRNLGGQVRDLISLIGARSGGGAVTGELRAEALTQGRPKPGTERTEQNLRQSLRQLNDLINRIETDRGKDTSGHQSGRTMSQLQALLHHLTAAQEKGRHEPASSAISSELRELSGKIASLIGSIRQEQAGRQTTDEGAQQGFNTAMHRNDTLFRRAAGAQTGQVYNRQFQEQLQNTLEQARISVRDSGNATLAMRLHPRELGSLNVNLGLEQGVINGRFTVQTEDARQLLLQNLEYIRGEMEQAGITVGDFQVNVSGGGEQFADGESDRDSAMAPQITDAQIAQDYGMSAQVLHDGGINVII